MTSARLVAAKCDLVDWFFDREPAEQREVYRHLQLYGFEGFKNIPDHNLFASCIDKGIFLMEE